MSFPLRLPDQLTQHLRALRKGRGLTQAQLGMLVGVKQARIAEIEANPGVVSLEQLTKVLAALGGALHLHSAGGVPHHEPATEAPKSPVPPKTQAVPMRRKAAGAAGKASRTSVLIRPKKGAW